MTCGHLFDDGPEETVLLLKPALILGQELVKVMEKHSVEHGALWMSGAVNSCHSWSNTSRSGPTCKN